MPLTSGTLNLWIAIRPDVPDTAQSILDLLRHQFPGLQLRIRTLAMKDFTTAWTAAPPGELPDVAFVNSFALLRPLVQVDAVWQNWGQDRFETHGRWVVSKRTTHLDEALALNRWLMASPNRRRMPVLNRGISVADAKSVESSAIASVRALMAGNKEEYRRILDPDAALSMDEATFASFDIKSIKTIETFGNSNLAFTALEVTGVGKLVMGVRYMSLIFRRNEGQWRLLRINRNETPAQIESTFAAFDHRLNNANQLGSDQAALPPPLPPSLVEPADNAVMPLPPTRSPELSWTVVHRSQETFIIELQVCVLHAQNPPPIDTTDLSDSVLIFVNVEPGQLTYKITAPFSVNAQPYRVRIWALDAAGRISFSSWHSMYFIYKPPSGDHKR